MLKIRFFGNSTEEGIYNTLTSSNGEICSLEKLFDPDKFDSHVLSGFEIKTEFESIEEIIRYVREIVHRFFKLYISDVKKKYYDGKDMGLADYDISFGELTDVKEWHIKVEFYLVIEELFDVNGQVKFEGWMKHVCVDDTIYTWDHAEQKTNSLILGVGSMNYVHDIWNRTEDWYYMG